MSGIIGQNGGTIGEIITPNPGLEVFPGDMPNTQTNPISIDEILQISLSNQYGVDIDDRLSKINNNFQAIVGSDFLKGEDGKDLCIVEWTFGQPIYNLYISGMPTSKAFLELMLTNAINMIDIEDTHWSSLNDKGLDGKIIYLICKDEGPEKTIISSLPFTYIDPRFSTGLDRIANISSLASKTDRSCIITFDNGVFNVLQSFPTIYYDSTIGDGELCWKINGEKTGLVCKGPAGKDGKSGEIAIVIIDKNDPNVDNKKYYDILGIYQFNSDLSSSEFIKIEEKGDKIINISHGQLLVCFDGELDSNGDVQLIKQDGNVYDYFLTYAYAQNGKYGAYAGEHEIRVNTMLSMATLKGLLDKIGTTSEPNDLKGIYVPSSFGTDNTTVTRGHAFYNDPNGDLHIGEVNPSDFSSNPNGDLYIDYPRTFINDCYLSPSSNGYDPCRSKNMTLQEAITKSGYESLTYDELVFKRNSKQLVPGCFYRITDYITTTSQEQTRSAGHVFDIIVLASDYDKLSEEAWATNHVNDLYFRNSNLQAWKIWYCLDNDTSRFAWAGGVTDNQMDHNQFFILDVRKHIFIDYDGSSAPDFLPISGWSKAYGQNGNLVPVLYNTYEGRDGNTYTDEYFYVGNETDNGITYNKWLSVDFDESLNDNEGHYILTDLIYKDSKMFYPGRGVIYRMIDEFGNDCPYDFKNIMFMNAFYGESLYMYTFDFILKDSTGNYLNFDASIKYPDDTVYKVDSKTYFKCKNNCVNNKLEYNINSWTQGSSNKITYYKNTLQSNLFIYDAMTISSTIGPVQIYWVDNYINGTTNIFANYRGKGESIKQISGNKLYNCHKVRNISDSEFTQGSAAGSQIIKNCTIYNINSYDASSAYTTPQAKTYVIDSSASNSLIFNGNIYANQVYQSNS